MSLIQDNLRALLISQRPSEFKSPQAGKQSPFISRVYNRDPVGLPPIKNNSVVTIEKKPQQTYVEFRNRQIIKQIQNLKKQEKDFLKEEEAQSKKKHEKYREFTIKHNNNINELRKEIYGEDYINQLSNNRSVVLNSKGGNNGDGNNNEREEGMNSNNLYNYNNQEEVKSVSNKEHKAYSVKQDNNERESSINREIHELVNEYNKATINNEKDNQENNFNYKYNGAAELNNKTNQLLLDASDEENDENLLKFMENLDYDKYVKNLEVREALYLLKNKVEKEKEKIQANDQNDDLNKANNANNEKEEINAEKLAEELQASSSLPPIENKNLVTHDKDWNEKREDAEVVKKRMADKILKLDKNLKTVHSFQSIKRLLEREGFDVPAKQSTLKISVVKDRDGMNNFIYKPSLLPNLREIPHL